MAHDTAVFGSGDLVNWLSGNSKRGMRGRPRTHRSIYKRAPAADLFCPHKLFRQDTDIYPKNIHFALTSDTLSAERGHQYLLGKKVSRPSRTFHLIS